MASRRTGNYDIPVSQRSASYASTSTSGHGVVHSNVLDRIHHYANLADNKLSEVGAPIKPYLPLIGRILVVSTFLEDTCRIVFNWRTQVHFISEVRGIPWIFTQLFFLFNVGSMLVGSFFVVTKKNLVYGVAFLVGALFSQAVIYGMIDMQFFARSVSLVGGLMLVVSDVFARERRRFPGLPEMDTKDRSQTIILAGRVLIVMLFVSHLIQTKWSLGAVLLNILSVTSCALLVVGYKARISASILALLLMIQNFLTNSYWTLNQWNVNRDHKRYEYFQVLSIIGGLILLVNLGAGKLSIDEKKRKIY